MKDAKSESEEGSDCETLMETRIPGVSSRRAAYLPHVKVRDLFF